MSDFHELLSTFMSAEGAPQLYSPRYAKLTEGDVKAHEAMWLELGVSEVKH
jgi:hypothetical protein